MKQWIPLAGAAFAVFLTGCTATAPRNFTVENGCFQMMLDNPAIPDDGEAFGCRFLRPGWITALYPAGSEISVFHTQSLYDHHPAFGCTQEIMPELELSPKWLLKIGVGVIEPNPVNHFRSKPIELFPWHVSFAKTGTRTVMTARQNSGNRNGYSYELTVTVTVTGDSPEIVQELLLRNTGSRRIGTKAYLHPFFNVPDRKNCRFHLAGEKSGNVFDMPEAVTERYRESENRRRVSAGFRTDRDYAVIITSDTPLDSSTLWHNQSNAFAVEPFIAVNVAPGEQQKWTWHLAVRTR